jgi:hypothetical protein
MKNKYKYEMVSTYNNTTTQYPCICVSPIQWVPGDLPPELKRPRRELTAHLQLVPRSRKRGSIHPLPHTSSWRGA